MGPSGICAETEGELYFEFLEKNCFLQFLKQKTFSLELSAPFLHMTGPAGTGKTESVKALGHQLGRFVLVFNCDETFDFQVRRPEGLPRAEGRVGAQACASGGREPCSQHSPLGTG